VIGFVKNAATTTSLGGTIAIAVRLQKPRGVEANVETTEVEIAEVEIAEAVGIKEVIEITTTIAHLVENIAAAMIAGLAEIPENPADGVQKARAAPASAEISRGAFI